MKKLSIFYLENCPYCKQAFKYLEELFLTGQFQGIELEKIEESRQTEVADTYDYYYVPSFYLEKTKLHEGACSEEEVEKVLNLVLNS